MYVRFLLTEAQAQRAKNYQECRIKKDDEVNVTLKDQEKFPAMKDRGDIYCGNLGGWRPLAEYGTKKSILSFDEEVEYGIPMKYLTYVGSRTVFFTRDFFKIVMHVLTDSDLSINHVDSHGILLNMAREANVNVVEYITLCTYARWYETRFGAIHRVVASNEYSMVQYWNDLYAWATSLSYNPTEIPAELYYPALAFKLMDADPGRIIFADQPDFHRYLGIYGKEGLAMKNAEILAMNRILAHFKDIFVAYHQSVPGVTNARQHQT